MGSSQELTHLVACSFHPPCPPPPSSGRIIQETEAVISVMINVEIRIGLPTLILKLISHLKLIFSMQLEISR